jgi:predicted site-specific integrase-resolvase
LIQEVILPGQRVGYIRVSSFDQNPERQLENVSVDRVFTDKASGKDTRRPELESLLAFVREGDTLAWIGSHATWTICAAWYRS